MTVVASSLSVDSRVPLFVAGKVWLTISRADFPEIDWIDSPLSVLGSMGTAVRDYLANGAGDMYFFEGPYLARLTPDSSDDSRVAVSGICDRSTSIDSGENGGTVEARVVVPLQGIIGSYQAALRSLEEWASLNGEEEVLSVLSRMERFTDY
ncbi:hypothetical protein ACFWWC_35365 [Streptomyces sp. NPDC058642]|uniref:hypothetical protein n=1 Tax=Streptomyces sp. NPDC058642 TaxID=3346572 RepID=UPI00365299A6